MNVNVHTDGRYAFVELRTPDMASASLQLNGQVSSRVASVVVQLVGICVSQLSVHTPDMASASIAAALGQVGGQLSVLLWSCVAPFQTATSAARLPPLPSPGATAGRHSVHRPAQRIRRPRKGGGGSHRGGGGARPVPGSFLPLPCLRLLLLRLGVLVTPTVSCQQVAWAACPAVCMPPCSMPGPACVP